MDFDYKKILIGYLHHIGVMEGTSFLGRNADNGVGDLTPEELAELRRLDEEINQ